VKGLSKGLAAGILIAIVFGGLLGFGLTYFFLMNNSGKILQTEQLEVRTQAILVDSDTTPQMIPDMTISINTSGSSYLILRFTTMYIHTIYSGHDGASIYNINLTLNGETIIKGYIGYNTSSILSNTIEFFSSFTLEYTTDVLPAGTYTITVTWESLISGKYTDSQLIFCSSFFNYSRYLIVQEIHI